MAIATERVARRYLNVVASVAIPVDFPVFEVEDVKVYYGRVSNVAVYNVDYTLALDPPNFNTFTITPLASLVAKIDALIVADPTETNFIVVRRVMDFLTVTNAGAVRDLPFLSRELDRTAMRFAQQGEQLQRAIKLSPKNVDQDPQIEELIEDTTLLYKNGKIVAGPTGQDVANAQANAAIALAKAAEAAASALAADADATQTAADRVQTGLDRTQTGLDKAATAADRVQTGLDKTATAADRVQTGLDKTATADDRVQTGLDKTATAADRVQTGLDAAATAADRVQTGLDRVAAAASAAEAALYVPTVASQAEAEAGTDNTKLMTPLRTSEFAANRRLPKLISETSIVSGAATVDISMPTDDGSGVAAYEFRFLGVLPATDGAALRGRISIDGGLSFITANDYRVTSAIGYFTLSALLGNSAIHGGDGNLIIPRPWSTTTRKKVYGRITGAQINGDMSDFTFAAYRIGGNEIITDFRFFCSTGNFASGVIQLYAWY